MAQRGEATVWTLEMRNSPAVTPSGQTLPFAGITVAIAVSESDHRRRVAASFADDFSYFGCKTIYVPDGDVEGLSADLLVLYGNCRRFHRYRDLLRRRVGSRPRVVICQIDPLPPDEIDERWEARALKFQQLFGNERWLRSVQIFAGLPVYRWIARRGFGVYSDPREGMQIDYLQARTVLEAYGYLRSALDEGWLDLICVGSIGKQEFLAKRGINAVFATRAYNAESGENRNQTRDIDVLFLGKLNKRRSELLSNIAGQLEREGFRVSIVSRDCFGEARTALLNRTKIVLHLHKYPWDTPWMRWALASACGAAVVSEPLSNPRPLTPGLHYVEAQLEDLPDTIGRLLQEPYRLTAMAEECSEFLREHMNSRRAAETILRDLFERPESADRGDLPLEPQSA